jgi:acyl dehydratase
MAQTVLDGVDAVKAAVGRQLGTSSWLEITQDRIDAFADATGDHQSTYLTLSLSNALLPEIWEVRGASLGVNYGTGQVRFPAPAPVGSRLRATAELAAAEDVPGGVQTTVVVTMEIEGSDEPACVIESLSRFLF